MHLEVWRLTHPWVIWEALGSSVIGNRPVNCRVQYSRDTTAGSACSQLGLVGRGQLRVLVFTVRFPELGPDQGPKQERETRGLLGLVLGLWPQCQVCGDKDQEGSGFSVAGSGRPSLLA